MKKQSENNILSNTRIQADEKTQLLGEVVTRYGLSTKMLIYAYVGLFVALFICLPKIYLSSNIYYISRHINSLQTQYDLLKEENRHLKTQSEKLRYEYLQNMELQKRIDSKRENR